jgi:hypothetical protein
MPVDIANSGIASRAFQLCEQAPISSFGDDSEEAITAAEQYGTALEACLEDCDWSFARRVARLSQVAAEPTAVDPDLTFEFIRPPALLAIRDVRPCDIEWRLDEDRIRSDFAGPIHVRYTLRIEDETRMSAKFRLAVSYRLAALLAPRWTTSLNRAQALSDQADDWLAKARRADRNTGSLQRYDGRDAQADWSEAVRR